MIRRGQVINRSVFFFSEDTLLSISNLYNSIFPNNRYSILAPNAIPQGFVDGKVVTEKILTALQLEANEYRLGITKVFFRAGVLGQLEDMRDERLSKIISLFQAWIRGYMNRKNYKKLQDQRFVGANICIIFIFLSLYLSRFIYDQTIY